MGRRSRSEPVVTRQLALDLRPRTRGGARVGAGRPSKKDSERGYILHRARAPHRKGEPVHVTLRVVKRLPSMREQVLARIIKQALLAQRAQLAAKGATHFQLVHFSIQSDHLHLLIEAPDKRGIARGIAGIEVRIARRINKALGRKGRFWADRYHRHDLGSPTETRHAIRYVLMNLQKHDVQNHVRHYGDRAYADWHSSAATFDGYTRPPTVFLDDHRWPSVAPRTWLLGVGWRRHGLIDPADIPLASGQFERGARTST